MPKKKKAAKKKAAKKVVKKKATKKAASKKTAKKKVKSKSQGASKTKGAPENKMGVVKEVLDRPIEDSFVEESMADQYHDPAMIEEDLDSHFDDNDDESYF